MKATAIAKAGSAKPSSQGQPLDLQVVAPQCVRSGVKGPGWRSLNASRASVFFFRLFVSWHFSHFEHDPVLQKYHAQTKILERDDDST
ncbi:hypothetical protein [Bradyrhizobium sp. ARR65]|uniref:hypothetical protein n=1 Tax=Bradyrhizobium sp. ARR65 TaxID=1040989 RepID=UPI0012FAA5BA|nr:hypothetical protein [Bradyrhizobium sp. ARR65]